MIESTVSDGFKLLAIRPMKGISPKLLKGLQEGFIYRLYNDYYYDLDNEHNILSIKHAPTVPSDLYGKNINVSAIVGQNGSGKSSLLELFYYAMLLCSKKHLKIEDLKFLESEFNAEIIHLKNDETIQVIKVSREEVKSISYTKTIINEEIVYTRIVGESSKEEELDFYTNVLNYSIYGLNSNSIPWIDLIFHKNDAYQLPIVISPFKEYGNYDINKEYMLMQSRALFYSYVIGFKDLIDHIYIHEISFEINPSKILEIENRNESTKELLKKFFSLNATEDEYNNVLFRDVKKDKLTSLYVVNTFLKDEDLIDGKRAEYSRVFYDKDLRQVEFYKVLTYLYIFKKLYKISKTYKKYKKYQFLFSDKLPFRLSFGDYKKINLSEIEHKSVSYANEFIYDRLMGELSLYVTDNKDGQKKEDDLSEEDLFYIREGFSSFYSYNYNNPKKIGDYLSNITFNEDSVSKNIKSVKKVIEELFNSKEFRAHWFGRYIQELINDTSHITFKLRQAINYFKFDIFNSIQTEDSSISFDSGVRKINLSIDRGYLKNRDKIEDIPLAVFNHVLEVVKTEEPNEDKRNELILKEELSVYPYTSLSSGEQQLINSILTIAYHNYNLLSVKEGNDFTKYKNINLIFDELELYLHPEYQRRYISNLINVLGKLQEVTNQHDIYYNVLMVTHSPFILSDIPSQNVLKLKNGKIDSNDHVNSFAANIYDLLKDEFFLNDGAIGAYAKSFINNLINEIEDLNSDTQKKAVDHLKDKIAVVGDELIRHSLEDYLLEKLNNDQYEISLLKERIKELESKSLKDEKN